MSAPSFQLVAMATVAALTCASCTEPPRREERQPLVIPFQNTLMVPLSGNVFAEPGLTAGDHEQLMTAHSAAAANVTRAFGSLRSGLPLTVFCQTAACKMTFGAPPQVAAALDLGFARDGLVTKDGFLKTSVVVATGPVSKTPGILTHEFVHAEMKAWVAYERLPTWFNEGMATFIANEPDCRSNPPVSDFDVTTLDTIPRWEAHIRAPRTTLRTYCQARDEVSRWAEQFPDAEAAASELKRLLQAVAAGASFESASARRPGQP